jgi:predicted Zn-dependent peptidase
MSCLKKDFADLLQTLAEVLRHPAFAEDKLEIARNQVNALIARQNDDANGIMFREFSEIVYGEDSPYARSETYATVAAISREDLVAWHEKYYHPNRMILGLVGDFGTEEALALVRKTFGDWPQGPELEDPEAAYNESFTPGVYAIEKSDMNQSNIAMGHLGILKNNADFYAVTVMNEILSGGRASRLFANVRTRKGLAYAVTGSVGSNWDHPGLCRMWLTTKTETTGAAIEALLEEARNMTAQPPTTEEVANAKAAILNSFVFNSDSRRKILAQQLTFEYYGYPLNWLARYRDGIESVTIEAVRQAAANYIHPDQFAILVVGPAEGRDKPLGEYGPVKAVDISIPEPEAPRIAATEETKQKGAALIAGVVDAMGGAARIDAVESIRREASAVATTPQGEMQLQVQEVMAYPDRVRQEISLPFGTVITVLSPDDAFVNTPQGIQPLPESQRADSEKSLRRNLLFLLRARNEAGFVAAAMGPQEFDGRQVEMVQVEYMDDVVSLAVDPESHHCIGMIYQGKDFSGARGEIVQVFSDFREVDSVSSPYQTTSTFNGKPFITTTTETLKLNEPLTADSFARPEASGGE